VIEVQELTKRYGATTAVDAISFHVPRGEIVGFLGPNGAGKSTTLRVLAGFLGATGGSVRIAGIDVAEDSQGARAKLGYMPEMSPLYPEMRVGEYLRFRAELKKVPRGQRKEAALRAMREARVDDFEDVMIGHLSKGYKQRVGLADALVASPPLLILDEPTAGLDPNQIREVRALIQKLGKDRTVLLSTHILSEVENVCSRIIIIRKGQLMAQGKASELRQSPTGTRLITLGGPASAEAYEKAVSGVEGVRNVELLGAQAGGNAICVTAVPGDAVLEAIFQAVVAQGLSLHRLVPESASLESVFADLTTTDPAGEPDDEADEGGDQADAASEGGAS
jgi:ABC-2 type transport system ATP-binding protein